MVLCITLLGGAWQQVKAAEETNLSRFLDLLLRRGLIYKVDEYAEFIGEGLRVPAADADLQWLYADWDSIAQELSRRHRFDSDDHRAVYMRSFEIPKENQFGYVWQWQHQGTPVYLILFAGSRAGFDMRLLRNTHNITVDEAVIAAHYDMVRSYYKPFKAEKWILEGVDTQYLPDALDHLGEAFLSGADYFRPFNGQIITLPYIELVAKTDGLSVRSSYHDRQYSLPTDFYETLPAKAIEAIKDPEIFVSADLKVSVSEHGDVVDVIAAAIYSGDYYERTNLYIKPVPSRFPGAGALPNPIKP